MKISLFSAFYPFRGGIAQFNERLVEELDKQHEVDVFTFKKQYPNWLFPGTSQYVQESNVRWEHRAKRIVSTFNPFSYFLGAKRISKSQPDVFIANYWMTIFAPFLAVFSRSLKGKSKRILLIHNLQPHEPKFFDTWFNRLVLKRFDGVVVLSEKVKTEVLSIKKEAKIKMLYHPWYDHFSPTTPKSESRKKLQIPVDAKVLLFFGLIRDYKGLDVLLASFKKLDSSFHLIIAGEFYGGKAKYDLWLKDADIVQRIHLADHFIPDSEVSNYFSASDLCVLPYKSATQSGVTATSFHFGVPVLVTDVGGLKEALGEKGLAVLANDVAAMTAAISSMFQGAVLADCKHEIEREREQFSWNYFAKELDLFCRSL